MPFSKTYDKVAWHFPEGRGCPSLAAAKTHFTVVIKWLESKGLLSAEGTEAAASGIDSDFALTADMLTAKGNRILGLCYDQWVRTVRYGVTPTTEVLDNCWAEEGSD